MSIATITACLNGCHWNLVGIFSVPLVGRKYLWETSFEASTLIWQSGWHSPRPIFAHWDVDGSSSVKQIWSWQSCEMEMLGTVVSSCPHAITLLSTGSTITAPFAGCKIKEREGKVKCENEAHCDKPDLQDLIWCPWELWGSKTSTEKFVNVAYWQIVHITFFDKHQLWWKCQHKRVDDRWLGVPSRVSSVQNSMHTTHLDVHIHHITRLSTKYHQNKWQHKYHLEIKHQSKKQATTTRKTNSNLKALLRPSE